MSTIEIDWDATRQAYFTIGRNPRYGVTWLRRGVDTATSGFVARCYWESDADHPGVPYVWDAEVGFFYPDTDDAEVREERALSPVDIMPEWDERWAVDTSGHLVHLAIDTSDELDRG